MKPALIDTDILSLFFRGQPQVIAHFAAYTREYRKINFSIITYYEILSGLKHRDAQKQLAAFLNFAADNNLVLLTKESVTLSADIYANTRSKGTPIDDIDVLIAGVALAHEWTLVTHNQRHFGQIAGLATEDWSVMEVGT
ncbi:MAG: type II toxin-antitoxin system VapC family toxin [Anaerolineae bacterium]|nr:type II toxin-antitoxin system VapC family toxin [Anaerolineae bacterium]